MNILHLHAGRHRAVGLRHRQPAGAVLSMHLPRVVPAHVQQRDAAAPQRATLHAHWSRNAVTGAMECQWTVDAPARRARHRLIKPHHRICRMHRRGSFAGLRPPSRSCLS